MTVAATLTYVTAGAGLVAAALWFLSARVALPAMPEGSPNMKNAHGFRTQEAVLAALATQSKLSAWAAGFASVAALAQAIIPFLLPPSS